MSDWKALREQAGLTLAQLAEKSGYSTGTINGLELHGEGSRRLKEKLRSILLPPENKDSVKYGRSESVESGVARLVDKPDNLSLEQWKLRAIRAEEKLEHLQATLRGALALSTTPPPPVSSKPASAAARYGAKPSASDQTDPSE